MEQRSRNILEVLVKMAEDNTISATDREQAHYAVVSFRHHRNACRLMAQYLAIHNGEALIHHSQRVEAGPETAVDRFGKSLLAIIGEFHVTPTMADLQGYAIELHTMIDPVLEDTMPDHVKFAFYRGLLSMEKKANSELKKCVEKYGYHWIFRAGLREYYMT